MEKAEGDIVEGVRPPFALPPLAFKKGAVHDLKPESEPFPELHPPLFEEGTGGGYHQNPMSKAPGHKLRHHETRLNCLAKSNPVAQEKPRTAHLESPHHRDELVGLRSQSSGLDGEERFRSESLLQEERLVVHEPAREGDRPVRLDTRHERGDVFERGENVQFLTPDSLVQPPEPVEGLRTHGLGENDLPTESSRMYLGTRQNLGQRSPPS